MPPDRADHQSCPKARNAAHPSFMSAKATARYNPDPLA
jgi:hypothetical protein